jgi:hypothetical protein
VDLRRVPETFFYKNAGNNRLPTSVAVAVREATGLTAGETVLVEPKKQ